MSHRPSNPDASSADDGTSPFGGLGAGLDMFQNWMKAASSAMPNLGGQGTSASSNWSMPTLDPEELDKRIQDLKTVQFWLEQNARMIGMTIQTLEVQRMTLETLKGMKVPLDAIRESLKVRPQDSSPAPASAPAAAPATPAPTESAPDASAADTPQATEGAVNPMQWWSTLTEQFSHLAQQAVQATQPSGQAPGAPKASAARKTSAGKKPTGKTAASKTAAHKTAAPPSAPRRKPQSQGD